MRRANEWTAERFRGYGLTATLEPYHFGVTWERGSASLRLIAPFTRAMTAHSWAWTEGTGGKTLSGPGGPHRSLHPGEPGGLSRQGERRLGASPARRSRSGIPTARR